MDQKNYLKKNKNLIEIGSNDGTFLSNFKGSAINTLGIEPSSNVAKISKKKGINTLNTFFTYKNVKKLKKLKKNIDIISAANVICHVPDLNDLIRGIEHLLNENGLFIFEEPYLGAMFEKTSYDQIYDEHIFMFSVNSIKKVFKLHNFDLINVIPQKTHGGSMRYVVGRSGKHIIKNNVTKFLQYEKRKKIDSIKGCLNFKRKCEISKKKLKKKISNILKKIKKLLVMQQLLKALQY